MDRNEAATIIQATLRASDYGARIWTAGPNVRVYVSELKKKGWVELGYVDLKDEGVCVKHVLKDSVKVCLERNLPAIEIEPTTESELSKLYNRYRRGENIGDEAIYQLQKAGLISMSAAMNSDF
ncbi:hypothetical protein [Gloeobacter morelensis]|uniref:hypothetical protein n=1 Tax=Gloeobacter morelensis TaxID=2907343 RepID=UPI001E3ABCD7|nr:hypothetical protein [Gloeobacter morelensis]UFP97279.1 hypothetical protein ISF26_24465 [Gloeobacter morelensis MG652769]